jgi:hypothetical protein
MDHTEFKRYPYKLEDIEQTVYEIILYEDDGSKGGYSIKERECLSKLNLKF